MLLTRLNKALQQFKKISTCTSFHLHLALLYLFSVILIALTGGVSSSYKVILLLPLFFYALEFGSGWGYAVSFANLLLIALFYWKGKTIRSHGLESDLVLSGMFFLVSWIAGKAVSREESVEREFPGMDLKDELTGLFGPAFMKYKLKKMIRRANRDYKIGLIFIKLSSYREFEESWGICAGNILLKKFSKSLLRALNEDDLAVHWGEGKFAVITRAGESSSIIGKAEKLRKNLNIILERGMEDDWKLPLAIGLSIFPDHAESFSSLIEKAEDALERAEIARGGRVQVYYSIYDRAGGKMKGDFTNTVKTVMVSIQAWDRFVYLHSERVSIYSRLACKGLKLPADKTMFIEYAALLHDIGKLEIKRKSLEKKGTLEQGELEVYRQHPFAGAKMLSQAKQMLSIIPSIVHHHERYDGFGYPSGLRGSEIPLGARIIAVADFFDHLTAADRGLKGKTLKEGIYSLLQQKGTRFDPLVVDAFVNSLKEYEDISHLIEWPKDLSKIVPSGCATANYRLGGHFAHYYSGELHFIIKALQCIAAGIANNEKCLYLMGEEKEACLLQQLNNFIPGLPERKIRVRPGQLERVAFPDYLLTMDKKRARFEFEMKKILKTWLDKAEKEQFDSLRLIIDHSSLYVIGEELSTWEKILTQCIQNLDVVIVCYYDFESITGQVELIEDVHSRLLVTTTDLVKEEKDAR